MSEDTDATAPELLGLVLAGGESRRMGEDKGALDYRGRPLVRRAWELLESLCARAYVSVRAEQTALPAYAGLPSIVDDGGDARGPVMGLLAAWAAHPEAAWLVLAADMPRVDAAVLRALIDARDPARAATVYVHADGALEPLCAIFEPAAQHAIAKRVATGDRSLSAYLGDARPRTLPGPGGGKLASVNTRAELGRIDAADAG